MTTEAERIRIIDEARALSAQAAQKPIPARYEYQARAIRKLAEIELSKVGWTNHWIGTIRQQISIDKSDFNICLRVARELHAYGKIFTIIDINPSSPVMSEILRQYQAERQSAEVAA